MKKALVILATAMYVTALAGCTGDKTENGSSAVNSFESSAVSSVSAEESSEQAENSEVSEESSEAAEKNYVENIDDYTVIVNEKGEQCISKYNGDDPYIIVPAEYDGKPIVEVLSETFDKCNFIRGIKVSEGIVNFGFIDESSDFNTKCTSIEEITLPSTLKSCGDFSTCSKLKEIVLPKSITVIGNGAFYGCSSLERAIMPGVKDLPLDAFCGCTKLKELVLAEDHEGFGRKALIDTAITELHLPDTFHVSAPGCFPQNCKLYMSEKLYNTEPAMSSIRDEIGGGISIMLELEKGSGVYYVERGKDFTFLKNDAGEYYIDKYSGKDEYIIIPPYYYLGVITTVSPDAFKGCDFIRGIKVGEALAENEEFMENLRKVLPNAKIIK